MTETTLRDPSAPAKSPRLFYGWVVVAAGFVVNCVGFGCVYSFTAFIESLQHDFGATRGAVSLVFSLAGFLYFCIGIVSGPLADRFGSWRVAVIGMILTGAGMALASFAHALTFVFAAYGLGIGLGLGFAYVPVMGAVQRWFRKNRGLASGLAAGGIGVGTLVFPPLAAWLIAAFGWRDTYLILGAIAVILGGGAALLIENDPCGRGLAPDGEALSPAAMPASASGFSIKDAIASRRFIGLYVACLACAFGAFVPFVHLSPYAMDHGVAQSSAVFLVSAIGIGSTAGRFFLGGLADRFGREVSLVAMFAGMAGSLVIWLVATTIWPLVIFALLFGTFYGGWVALLPAVVMDYFGGRNVSGLIGILYTSAAFGTLIGPAAAGFAFDVAGSYALPILGSIAGNVIAAAVMAIIAAAPPAAAQASPHPN